MARSSETCIANYHNLCPGDFRLDPLLAKLNRRRAVVFMHPASLKCPCCQTQSLCCPRLAIEFMFEITRAVANLLLTGTFARFADFSGSSHMPVRRCWRTASFTAATGRSHRCRQ